MIKSVVGFSVGDGRGGRGMERNVIRKVGRN